MGREMSMRIVWVILAAAALAACESEADKMAKSYYSLNEAVGVDRLCEKSREVADAYAREGNEELAKRWERKREMDCMRARL